jgi:acetylornithine/N-succinyldiaminopimelate aminotransferase
MSSSVSSHAFDTGSQAHCPFMPVFGPPAVMFERGEGTQLFDVNNKRYLDFLAGIAVVSLGHANTVIAEAICAQAHTLVHVSNFFANPVATEAAIKINSLLHEATGHAGQVFFTNSGAEANECALKLARRHGRRTVGGDGRYRVITALGSFHGRTLATLAATGQPAKHIPFAPMPDGFSAVPWGDLDALRAAIDPSVAAILIEPLQGEGGVVPAPAGYLQGVREICDEAGILMMVDEIQTGFARTGAWFGFEHSGVRPDVVTLAKAMGNGMPIGACWARHDVADAFQPGDHGSTYSGTALATAAVVAVIDEMHRLDAPNLARNGENLIRTHFGAVAGVASIRGAGLLLGIELDPGIASADVVAQARNRGLILNAVTPTALRCAPPLTVSENEIVEAAQILAAAIAACQAGEGSQQ